MESLGPLPMVGREEWVAGIVERLERPDDLRSNPKDFKIPPCFYGLGGVGKSRLLGALAERLGARTPYVARVDFAERAAPGTPRALLRAVIEQWEAQDRAQRLPGLRGLLPGRYSTFAACYALLDAEATELLPQPERVGAALTEAIKKLRAPRPTRRAYGGVGEPSPRPLLVLLLDTVEQATRPVRAWLPTLPALFGGENRVTFHVLCVAAGREALAGLLEQPLPSLDAALAERFVEQYAQHRYQSERARRAGRWQSDEGTPPGAALRAQIVAAGAGVPLLLQTLTDLARIAPAYFADNLEGWEALVPDQRFEHVQGVYLERLAAEATRREDEDLWQRYYLHLYSAIPRALMKRELLEALLIGMPDSPLQPGTRVEALWERLRAEPFISVKQGGRLEMHDLVREGTLRYVREQYPARWKSLHERAGVWFRSQGHPMDWAYHAVQSDYAGTMAYLKREIEPALSEGRWGQVQVLLDSTRDVTLTPTDNAWFTLYKAELAWGEENAELAMQRLALLFAEPTLTAAVQERLARWLGLEALATQAEGQAEPPDLPVQHLNVILWWAEHCNRPALCARAHQQAGTLACKQYRWFDATHHLEQARAIYERMGDLPRKAAALQVLGEVGLATDDYAEAQERYEAARTLHEVLGEQQGQAAALAGLGDVALLTGEYDQAREQYKAALTLYEELGERRYEARALVALGEVALLTGQYAQAGEWYEAARGLYRALGSQQGQAQALRGLGHVARGIGMYVEARKWYEAAQDLYQEVGDRRGQAHTLLGLGAVALKKGEYAVAGEKCKVARRLFRELGDRRGQAYALAELGQVALVTGNYEQAGERYEEVLALSHKLGHRLGQAHALLGLGQLAVRTREYVAAWERYGGALTLYKALGDRDGQAHALLGLGRVARVQRQYDESGVQLRAALRLYSEMGLLQDVLGVSISEGRALLDQRDRHRAAEEEAQAAAAHALAAELADYARQVVGQATGDDVGRWEQSYQAFRARLGE